MCQGLINFELWWLWSFTEFEAVPGSLWSSMAPSSCRSGPCPKREGWDHRWSEHLIESNPLFEAWFTTWLSIYPVVYDEVRFIKYGRSKQKFTHRCQPDTGKTAQQGCTANPGEIQAELQCIRWQIRSENALWIQLIHSEYLRITMNHLDIAWLILIAVHFRDCHLLRPKAVGTNRSQMHHRQPPCGYPVNKLRHDTRVERENGLCMFVWHVNTAQYISIEKRSKKHLLTFTDQIQDELLVGHSRTHHGMPRLHPAFWRSVLGQWNPERSQRSPGGDMRSDHWDQEPNRLVRRVKSDESDVR